MVPMALMLYHLEKRLRLQEEVNPLTKQAVAYPSYQAFLWIKMATNSYKDPSLSLGLTSTKAREQVCLKIT
jgi:hypothetical protein